MTTLREAARTIAAVLEEKGQAARAADLRTGLGVIAWYMPDILYMEYGRLCLGQSAHGPLGLAFESVVIDGGIISLETRSETACERHSLMALLTQAAGGINPEWRAEGSDLTRNPRRIRPPCGGHGPILRSVHADNV